MLDTLKFKPLTAQDRTGWEFLWKGYEQFYKAHFHDALIEATWKKLLDPLIPVYGFLAFDQTKAIGLVHYLFHETTWTEAPYCYLQDLYVVHQARGKGVAKRLIELVVSNAKKYNATRVYWLTHKTNTEARGLYDKVAKNTGFIQYKIPLT